ncbi:hypothetical protein [Pedobacter terrae]|nr:hypothetical protein [Pedobacter terrae]
MTNKSSIKCDKCDTWNSTKKNSKAQRCKKCGNLLDPSRDIFSNNNDQDNFLDRMPPYAKYVFIALVSIIGGVIVFALA